MTYVYLPAPLFHTSIFMLDLDLDLDLEMNMDTDMDMGMDTDGLDLLGGRGRARGVEGDGRHGKRQAGRCLRQRRRQVGVRTAVGVSVRRFGLICERRLALKWSERF